MTTRKPLKGALGLISRNLLAPSGAGDPLEGARELPLDLLDHNPQQPRQVFDAEALAGLAADIAERGVLQPIIVRPVAERYQIVAGERRYRAARRAGLTTIPALIRNLNDEE